MSSRSTRESVNTSNGLVTDRRTNAGSWQLTDWSLDGSLRCSGVVRGASPFELSIRPPRTTAALAHVCLLA